VNVGKTKVILVSKDGSTSTRITCGTETLDCPREFTYLVTVFTADGKLEKEVERRTQAGRAALGGINKQVVWNRVISVKVKKVLFSALVKSRLTY
jgi:formylmethanofuran dehydrogenase subunit E